MPADVVLAIVCGRGGLPPQRRKRMHRRPDSATLVHEVIGLGPDWFGYTVRRYSVRMPHGGYRTVMACPGCERWVTRLYLGGTSGPSSPGPWRCRTCLGLRYASQYSGRRPEAAHERLLTLSELMERSRYRHTFDLRLCRLREALSTLNRREVVEVMGGHHSEQ